jgi:hypothetical protein
MKPLENISQEIEDLREQLLSLDEEIWGSVEHRDTKALHAYLPLKEKINERIKIFQQAANDLLACISELPEIQLPEELFDTNEMIGTLAPLDRSWAFHHPAALEFEGARIDTASWRKLWHTFLTTFRQRHPDKFERVIVRTPCIAGVRDVGNDLHDPFECGGKWFECCLSANAIRDRIKKILLHAGIDTGRVKAILRGTQDR